MKFLIVRHGPTDLNGIDWNIPDQAPLKEIHGLEIVAEALKNEFSKGVAFSISSPTERARRTASIILEKIGSDKIVSEALKKAGFSEVENALYWEREDVREITMGFEDVKVDGKPIVITTESYVEFFLNETDYKNIKKEDYPHINPHLAALHERLEGSIPTYNDVLGCQWKDGVDSYESYAKSVIKTIRAVAEVLKDLVDPDKPIAIFTHSTFLKVALAQGAHQEVSHNNICNVKAPTGAWGLFEVDDDQFLTIKYSEGIKV
jgi:broad specificity phosphatase PhoE